MIPLTNSDLKSIKSHKKLAYFLHCDKAKLKQLEDDSSYMPYTVEKTGRHIEVPNDELMVVLKLIEKALTTEELPQWLMSSKGKGIVKNAIFHYGHDLIVTKFDISKFYGSCKWKYIYHLFYDSDGYGMPKDIAKTLSNLVTYDGHLPTGSPASPLLAYLAYRKCFDEIYKLTKAHGFKMSLYVDDITLSYADRTSITWIKKTIREILNNYGLDFNVDKTKTYDPSKAKNITGIVLNPKKLYLTIANKSLLKLHDEQIKRSDKKPDVINGLKNYKKSVEKNKLPK